MRGKPKTAKARRAKVKAGLSTIERNRKMTATLHTLHIINGLVYGPGEVTGPTDLIRSLLNTEGNVATADMSFYGTKGVIIGPGRRLRQVPVESLDSDALSFPEAEFINKSDWRGR